MKNKKITLIRPPVDDWYKVEQLEAHVGPQIGLSILAKSVRQNTDFDVEIIDGLHLSLDKIKGMIDPSSEFVGMYMLYSNHLNALNISEYAKTIGKTTLVGGPGTFYLAERILANRDFVDFAVVGDGEEALPLILQGDYRHPNIVHKASGKVIRSAERPRKAKMEIIFDLEDIINRPQYSLDNAFSISSIRGCIKAEKYDRCSFCSIPSSLAVMDPWLVWAQIDLSHNKYGFKFFFHTGDSFFVGDYPQRLLNARPSHLEHITHYGYASPQQITKETRQLLLDLNFKKLFVGIESLDDNILRQANKGYTVRDIENAMELMADTGISLHVPFMYGLPGETQGTAHKSFEFAKQLIQSSGYITVISSFPVPFAGTELFNFLRTNEHVRRNYKGNLARDDFFDYDALVRMQFNLRTPGFSYEDAEYFIKATKDLARDNGMVTSFSINKQKV